MRISCAALATFWKEVEVWFAWLSRSRNCSGSISHGPRCRPRHRRTCRTTYPLSARLYKVDMARKKKEKDCQPQRERTGGHVFQPTARISRKDGPSSSSSNSSIVLRFYILEARDFIARIKRKETARASWSNFSIEQ